MWFGQGFPSANGPAVFVAGGLAYAFLLALPIYSLFQQRSDVLVNFAGLLGCILLGLIAFGLLPYMLSIERLGRFELLGFLLSVLSLALLFCAGFQARTPGLLGWVRFACPVGYGMVGGTLLAGQVQAGLALLLGLAVVQGVAWIAAPRPGTWVLGAIFAFVIPMTMILSFPVGHTAAVPLIMSFLLGFALNWQPKG